MHLNREYGRLDAEGAIEYAPKSVKLGGVTNLHPTAEDYALLGYKSVSEAAPSKPAPEGYHYEPRGYDEDETRIWRVYETVANSPAPPRRWSRFSIKGALADARLLPAAKAFLAAYELKPDYTALEAFTDVDYIEEWYGGAEAWNALLDGAAQALGKTREEIDAFLDAIPRE